MIHKVQCGDLIGWNGATHRVEGLQGVNIRLRDIDTGEVAVILAAALVTEANRVDPESPPPRQAPGFDVAAMVDILDPNEAERVRLLESLLVRIRVENEQDASVRVQELVDDAAESLGITPRSVFRYYAAWRDQGTWGLVDKRKTRLSDPLRNVPAELAEAITDQARIEVLESTATFSRFKRRLSERLANGNGGVIPDLPSDSTLRRALAAIALGSLDGPADSRKTKALQPDKTYGRMTATRPGETVMFDTDRLDVIAYDPVTDKTSAVELTVAMDVATRSVLAWRLTPVGTTATDVALMLADMLTPEAMRPGWDDAVRLSVQLRNFDHNVTVEERLEAAAGRPVILPETVVIDHGKIFVGEVFTSACHRLGISMQPARKARPTDKAIIERSFGTMRTQFAEAVAGFKGRSVAHRGEHIEQAARWTIEELAEFFAEYVVCVWQRRSHSGLPLPGYPAITMSPNEAYAEAIARTGWISIPDDPNLYFELLPVEWRAIHRYGVEIGGMTYDGDVLNAYRRAKSPYPGVNGRWPFRVDPRSPLHAFFRDQDGGWHALRWTHAPDTMQPFTDVTAAYVRRRLRQEGMAVADQSEVVRALLDLQRRMDDPSTSTATDRRALTRDRSRTRAALKDQARAGLEVPEAPELTVVHDNDGDEIFDLDEIPPYEGW